MGEVSVNQCQWKKSPCSAQRQEEHCQVNRGNSVWNKGVTGEERRNGQVQMARQGQTRFLCPSKGAVPWERDHPCWLTFCQSETSGNPANVSIVQVIMHILTFKIRGHQPAICLLSLNSPTPTRKKMSVSKACPKRQGPLGRFSLSMSHLCTFLDVLSSPHSPLNLHIQ